MRLERDQINTELEKVKEESASMQNSLDVIDRKYINSSTMLSLSSEELNVCINLPPILFSFSQFPLLWLV